MRVLFLATMLSHTVLPPKRGRGRKLCYKRCVSPMSLNKGTFFRGNLGFHPRDIFMRHCSYLYKQFVNCINVEQSAIVNTSRVLYLVRYLLWVTCTKQRSRLYDILNELEKATLCTRNLHNTHILKFRHKGSDEEVALLNRSGDSKLV